MTQAYELFVAAAISAALTGCGSQHETTGTAGSTKPGASAKPDDGSVARSDPRVRAEADAGSVPSTPTGNGEPSEATIDFAPSRVDATRTPTTCGVMNPPFIDGDVFSLDVIGKMTAGPYNALSLSFTSPAPPLGMPLSLTVMPFSPRGDGIGAAVGSTTWYAAQNAQGSGLSFQYSQGSDPSEIDAGAFDSVVVTLLRLPEKDGEPFTARIQIHFVDGQRLDATFSSSLTSSYGSCPAG